MLTVIQLFAIICTLIAWKWRDMLRWRRRMKMLNKLPTWPEKAYPILGHVYLFPKDNRKTAKFMLDKCLENQAEKKSKFLFWRGSRPNLVVTTPDSVQAILKSTRTIEKSNNYRMAESWLGTGLLTSGGAKWKTRRRLITPTFHFDILDKFREVICEHAGEFVEIVDDLISSTSEEEEQDVDIAELLSVCTLDMICETAMGENVKAQRNTNCQFLQSTKRMLMIVHKRIHTPLFRYPLIFSWSALKREQDHHLAILHDFTRRVIDRRMSEWKRRRSGDDVTSGGRLAFLDLLINSTTEDGGRLREEDIQEEVDTFMFEGHDTTSTALLWIFYLVGLHTDVQLKLQREIDDVITNDDDKCAISNDELSRLVYLERVIKESLRIFPSVPSFSRTLTEDTWVDGDLVPAGTDVSVFARAVHLCPEHWPEPERFDPDRFSKERSIHRHPFAYVPFSAGPRNCIGQKFAMMEMKIVLARFLRRFSIRSLDPYDRMETTGMLILRPFHKINIKIARRTSC